MPVLSLANPAQNDFGTAFRLLARLEGAGNPAGTPSALTLTADSLTFTLSGSGLSWVVGPDGLQITGGTVAGITISAGTLPMFVLTGLAMDGLLLNTALLADRLMTDDAALETLFLSLDWTLQGHTGPESCDPALTSGDGVPLLLTGDTFFALGRGYPEIIAGTGNDTIQGSSDGGRHFGGDGNDAFSIGGTSDAELYGDAGNDRILGGSGRNLAYGGAGRDTVQGGRSRDTLNGDDGNDQIAAGDENDFAYGGNGRDIIDAGEGNDATYAGSGADVVLAGGGDDDIHGGFGKDTLNGGGGADRFNFDCNLDPRFNVDRVQDFVSGEDLFVLYRTTFDGLAPGALPGAAFATTGNGQATEAGHRIILDQDDGHLYFDPDGTGAARILFARVNAGLQLVPEDFLVF